MSLTRDQALAQLHAWTTNPSLLGHARAVEIVMRAAAGKKKLKDKAFAAKVDREIIRSSVELLGADFDQHVQFVIDALKPHAEELGIAGKK